LIILNLKNFRIIPLNQLYKPVPNKSTGKCTLIMTKDGKECKKLIQLEVLRQKQKKLLAGDILLYIDIIKKGKQSPDIDALLKLLQDSLEGYCYKNDKQIVDLRVRKHLNSGYDEVNLMIKEIKKD